MLPRRLPALAQLLPVDPVRGPFLAAWHSCLLPGGQADLCLTCAAVHRFMPLASLMLYPWTAAADALKLCLDLQIAIAATDLAEIIGSATALYLLFGLPVWAGVLITGVVSNMPVKLSISSPYQCFCMHDVNSLYMRCSGS